MTTRRGYVVALLLFLGGAAALVGMIWRLSNQVDQLQRIAVPGTSEISLPAGESIGYAEPAERADGDVGGPSFSANCNAVMQDGSKVTIATPSAQVSYRLGSREGVSIMSIKLAEPGMVTITCTAGDAFTLAIGGGVGTSIVVGILALLVGVIAAVTMVVRTWRRRRRERRSAVA